uniref:Uncharacterized protein n=1 Tax=Amazona collaria TaxID=241587 RepID=A0A8B9GCR8_9PSIT
MSPLRGFPSRPSYLQRRAQEERLRRQRDKKERLRQALDENRLLPTELRREALELQKELEFDAPGVGGECHTPLA